MIKFSNPSFLLSLIFVLLIFLSISWGSVNIPIIETIKQILSLINLEKIDLSESSKNIESIYQRIIYYFRLPRTLTAILAGANLSCCGLILQTFFQNPLAGPGILGISSGARLMSALFILGFSFFGGTSAFLTSGLLLSSFFGAGMVLFLLLFISHFYRDPYLLLIFGVMIGFFISALISIIISLSSDESIKKFVFWGFGSFNGLSYLQIIFFFFITLIGFFLSLFLVKSLNALLLGYQQSQQLGHNLNKIQLIVLFISCMQIGVVNAFCGPIAFVGIAAPHLARYFYRSNQIQKLLPGVILIGSMMSVGADIIARLPGLEQTIPLNAVLSFFGFPVIIILLLKNKQNNK